MPKRDRAGRVSHFRIHATIITQMSIEYNTRNTVPSVATLEAICAAFGISLAQFFAEGRLVELTAEQQEMFAAWSTLTKPQKEALQQLILVMKEPI